MLGRSALVGLGLALLASCGADPEATRGDGTLSAPPAVGSPASAAIGSRVSVAIGSPDRASAVLPERADQPVWLEAPSGHRLGFSLVGAAPVSRTTSDGLASYARALPSGDWIQRQLPDGLEDYVLLRSPAEVSYRLDVSSVAGLRLVADTLELVDASGTPRLRMRAPEVVDARGEARPIALELVADGSEPACAADRDPRAPWGRAPVAPGSASCRVALRFDDAGLRYPLLVDPMWTTTGSMSTTRSEHAGAALPNGKALVAGGWGAGTSAELYDPVSKTFAATGAAPTGGSALRAETLLDNRVLAVAGTAGQIYDSTLGTWSATGALPAGYTRPGMTRLADGKVLVALGTNAALYDPSGNSWTSVGPMPFSHSFPTATTLPSGKVLVVGGGTNTSLYDPTQNTWSAAAPLNQARQFHAALLLASGKAIVIGGQKCGGCAFTNTAELYDPGANTWAFTGSMAEVRMQVVAATLPTGKILVPGGWTGGNLSTKNVELYDPVTGSWATTQPMADTRREHALTALPGGQFLVTGGTDVEYNDLASAEVFGLLGVGEPCTASIECATLQCIDGVCCSSACASLCRACSAAKKGYGSDGVCEPVVAGKDPDSECADDGVASCGKTGFCDGAGACQLYPSGAVCFGPSCTNGVVTSGSCTGSGTCVQSPTACAPYVCASGSSCGSTCTSDSGCAASAWCKSSDGTCQPDQANGAACTTGSQCQSGHCVDGVCCDSPCNGICQACTASAKQSGTGDGICGFAKLGADPHATCPDDGAASCQRDGFCDGAGACRFYASGTACGATACLGNVQSGFACNGSGTCNPGTSVDCGNYLCVVDQCSTSCTSDSDCVDAAWCSAGACVKKGKNGDACSAAGGCLSGQCVDGVCCDSACAGQCEACNVSGAEGTCVPVSGAPKSGRPACAAASAGEPCSERACDGIARESCEGYVGAGVECRAAGCADGVATKAAACDGKGSCPSAKTQECEPYACGAESCKTTCSADPDCAPGAICNATTGRCDRADVCLDEQTVQHADGTQADCAPYLCKAGACRKTCTSVADCVAPYLCDSESRCSLASGSSAGEDSGGCGCRTARRDEGSRGALFALFALFALGRRRRVSAATRT